MNRIWLILWTLAGILVLTSREITHFQYAMCWAMLLFEFIEDVLEEEQNEK